MEVRQVDGGFIINFSSGFQYDYFGVFGISLSSPVSRDRLIGVLESLRGIFRIQFLNADSIVSWRHVASAALKALRSFKCGRNISHSIEMELLLYCSGERQIKDALRVSGLGEFVKDFVLAVFGSSESEVYNGLKRFLDSCLEAKLNINVLSNRSMDHFKHLMELFNVSEDELKSVSKRGLSSWDALEYILIERGCALEVYK
ncbi:MAG: hypothetical protein LM601_00020 [Candidatus Verstraetearchaeota archaeon]|nr:hypothetical protein [Candidatus Verstraetearchaeota archaeon]